MQRILLSTLLAGLATAAGADYKVDMNAIDARGVGAPVGTIAVTDAKGGGVTFTPDLRGLPAGAHGFHVHEFANCGAKEKDGKVVAGALAGDHWDPDKSGKHGSHRGDLPVLEVAGDGSAKKAITVPKLKLSDLRNKALVIHAGGDNGSDQPKPNGGGGDRIACGVVQPGVKP